MKNYKCFTCPVNENKYYAKSMKALKSAMKNTELSDTVFFEIENEGGMFPFWCKMIAKNVWVNTIN